MKQIDEKLFLFVYGEKWKNKKTEEKEHEMLEFIRHLSHNNEYVFQHVVTNNTDRFCYGFKDIKVKNFDMLCKGLNSEEVFVYDEHEFNIIYHIKK